MSCTRQVNATGLHPYWAGSFEWRRKVHTRIFGELLGLDRLWQATPRLVRRLGRVTRSKTLVTMRRERPWQTRRTHFILALLVILNCSAYTRRSHAPHISFFVLKQSHERRP